LNFDANAGNNNWVIHGVTFSGNANGLQTGNAVLVTNGAGFDFEGNAIQGWGSPAMWLDGGSYDSRSWAIIGNYFEANTNSGGAGTTAIALKINATGAVSTTKGYVIQGNYFNCGAVGNLTAVGIEDEYSDGGDISGNTFFACLTYNIRTLSGATNVFVHNNNNFSGPATPFSLNGAGNPSIQGTDVNFSSMLTLELPTGASFVTTAPGQVGYDTTNNNYHVNDEGTDLFLVPLAPSFVSGNCAEPTKNGSNIKQAR